ncbi:hypothetical protein R69619_01707 [Paraburkholderia nemoris]|nr:hypothetical protein R69619_01707 [Paraburkholderia nemoris]
MDTLDSLSESFQRSLPTVSPLWQASFGFNAVDGQPSTVTSSSRIGTRYEGGTEPYVLQARTNGLALSRLRPYMSWEPFRDQAKAYWDEYLGRVQPQGVSRLAVRYINAIEVPLPVDDLGVYLAKPPDVPEGLPQSIGGFFLRTLIFDSASENSATVTLACEGLHPGGDGNRVTIFLDIDAFRAVRLDGDAAEIWQVLLQLRELKNRVFFEYLTEHTIGLME